MDPTARFILAEQERDEAEADRATLEDRVRALEAAIRAALDYHDAWLHSRRPDAAVEMIVAPLRLVTAPAPAAEGSDSAVVARGSGAEDR